MLSAFLDESGQERSGIFAVGGYVFDWEGCQRFENEWARVLNSVQPSLTRFHMTDFENRRGSYADWPEAFRRDFLNHLMGILKTTPAFGMSVAVDLEAFAALPADDKAELRGATPYSLGVQIAIRLISDQISTSDDVAYILDIAAPRQGKTRIKNEFEWLLANRSEPELAFLRLGSLTWLDSVKAPQLQAADVLVYEYAKDVARRLSRPFAPQSARYPARILTDGSGTKLLHLVVGAERLQELAQRIRVGGGLSV